MNNRIIKFRIWDIYNKNFINYPYGFSLNKNFELSIPDDSSDGIVRKFIIQQFTGLIDENEKEIYEGDIVRWYHGITDIGEVKFSGSENNFGGYPNICFYGVHVCRLHGLCIFQSDDEYEVIGNIFENPELIA